jgi:L-seryl-tRNA(Ser) seleniumtransferase
MRSLRSLPSVDQLLKNPVVVSWIIEFGRHLTLDSLRQTLDEARKGYKDSNHVPSQDEILERAHSLLQIWVVPSIQPVINATGVILHTNLGRAPLSTSTLKAIQDASKGYSNLEYDLLSGRRGSRLVHAESLLTHITHAEAALVVNNNAAAVLLSLSALARRRAVIIARSQLVEIGGGFRIPDVMKQSGARLLEVGTTNRVHLSDYQSAIKESEPAMILHAHRSNFQITGFTSEPNLHELADVAHQAGIPLVDDQGSGALLDTALFGLSHEPTVNESLASNSDLVCFSGDKLLGGPQAGIIIGKADLITRLKKHPLARAIRADKLCLAGLSATLLHYLKDEAITEIPVWRMIAIPSDTLRQRVQNWINLLGMGTLVESQSTIGGGSLPNETLPTYALALSVHSPNRTLEYLRLHHPPVIARLEADKVLFDPRTIMPEQENDLLSAIRSIPIANQSRGRSIL